MADSIVIDTGPITPYSAAEATKPLAAGATLQRFLEAHNVPLVTVEQIAQALGMRLAGLED